MADKAKDILNLPYSRLLVPDETGGYTAQVVEFPGCFSEGDTAEEAVRNLENAAHAWVEAALAQDLRIPPPTGGIEYSGRFALRLPRSLHARAARYAQQDGVSLNQFIVAAVAEMVGATKTTTALQHRVDLLCLGFNELAQRIGNDTILGYGVTVNLADLDQRAQTYVN